ncbi:MAG: sugar ABC transporter substrate-binding protein [Thermomicrobiales bacterium]
MFHGPTRDVQLINRRRLLGFLSGAVAAGIITRSQAYAYLQDASDKTGVTAEEWNIETINAKAGTRTFDTAGDAHAIVPESTEGAIAYWNNGPTEASPDIAKTLYQDFLDTFALIYPNITLDNQNVNYNDLLDKIRTAAAGGAAPDVAKMPILWGVEFAARGGTSEITFEEFGLTPEQFWPGALKSVTWEGKYYGVPTNNETMAFIWNKQLFADAGLDPENPPATWDDVVAYSNQIKQETGKNGYGMVCKVNAGNTPFRFMPVVWAYGASALDEADDEPTYATTKINSPEGIAALQTFYDMYVRDQSVPTSALTNTQTENQDLFIAGEIAMMIAHPSEYIAMRDRAAKATGADKEKADAIVASMSYGLIPEGPARRAVVFGGSNAHIMSDEAHGSPVNRDAARALVTLLTSPEWSLKNNWSDSNPANLLGFETEWMKQRLEEIKFLEVTTAMLPYGIPFPVVPESPEVMNIIIPEMLQNALTESMTVEEAANDAADRINELIAQR